jgi:hypothetical protein
MRRRGRGSEWYGVPGCVVVECGPTDEGEWIIERPSKTLPEIVVKDILKLFPLRRRFNWVKNLFGLKLIDQRTFELIINFESSGYYQPAQLYGPPEKCYPAEGNDERELDGTVEVILDRDHKGHLSKEASEAMFDLMQDEVYEAELEHSEPDPPDERDY